MIKSSSHFTNNFYIPDMDSNRDHIWKDIIKPRVATHLGMLNQHGICVIYFDLQGKLNQKLQLPVFFVSP